MASIIIAGCDGGDDSTPAAPPVATAACSWDTTVTLSYEEQRLQTPLPNTGANVVGTSATPIADRLVKDVGFDGFATDLATQLCPASGQTTVVDYDSAIALLKTQGHALWTAAVDRVQGRRASPAGSTLPNSDDRPLYWARLQMTKALRQWKPAFAPTPAQQTAMQLQLERSSRGEDDIALPAGFAPSGAKYRRLILSGFDTFTLGTPGSPNTGLRNGNPSGATALSLDGKEFTLSDGSILHIETYLLPVNYDPFNLGMQEDTIGPWFKPGPQRVDASISMSQGSANIFNLEQWNGRFHGPSAGNDGIIYCPTRNPSPLPNEVLAIGTVTATGTAPLVNPGSGCDVYPPQRWLGYDSLSTWMKDFPAQFTTTSLPIAALVTGKTQAGIVRPPGATSSGTEGFDVTSHTSYTYFGDCNVVTTTNVNTSGVVNAMPDQSTLTQPQGAWCSRQGGGGDYLSNESAYRNTLLRDVFGLDIPAGHMHTPVMTNFFGGTVNTGGGTRDDNAITDARFESYRTAIVTQAQRLVQIVGESLVLKQDQ
ncbi:MAG TPA: hypothetical protein VGM74_01490 [Burkholderiaceae bacterium]